MVFGESLKFSGIREVPKFLIFGERRSVFATNSDFLIPATSVYKHIYGVRKSEIVSKTQFLSIFSRIYCCDGVNNVK